MTPEGYRFSQDRHRLAERGRVAYYLRVTGPKEAPRTGNCGTNTDRWNWPQATDQQWVNGPRALTFGRNESALSARAAQTRLQSDYRPLSSKGEAAREPCLSHHPPGRETAPWGVSHRAVPGARQRALMKPAGEPYSTGSITVRLLPHVRGAEEFVSVLASGGLPLALHGGGCQEPSGKSQPSPRFAIVRFCGKKPGNAARRPLIRES